MNTHTLMIASLLLLNKAFMRAGPMLLAGLTDVPVRPIPKMCTSVSVRPIISPPNEPWPAFFDVTPSIVRTKMNVSTISTTHPAAALPCTPARPFDPKAPVLSSTPPSEKMAVRIPEPAKAWKS